MACSLLNRFGVLMITPFFLVSCGGGAGSDSPATSTISSSSTSAVKMEVINGITVPPEPDKTQNEATIKGVDVDSNGLRDDVDREIAKKVEKGSEKTVSDIAKSYERIIHLNSSLDIENEFKNISCNIKKLDSSLNIADLVINNDERFKTYLSKIRQIDNDRVKNTGLVSLSLQEMCLE